MPKGRVLYGNEYYDFEYQKQSNPQGYVGVIFIPKETDFYIYTNEQGDNITSYKEVPTFPIGFIYKLFEEINNIEKVI